MELWKLGCRWGSGTSLFYDFIRENNIVIGWVDKDYLLGSFILVTDGHTVLDIAEVKSERRSVLDFPLFESKFRELNIPYDDNIFIYEASFYNITEEDRFIYPLQQGIVRVQSKEYINKFLLLKTKYIKSEVMKNHIELLKYKKQIILQGPPGTGKTREAKILADVLIRENLSTINFLDYFKVNDKIANYSGVKNYYTIMDVNKDTITLKNEEAKEERSVTLNDVIDNFEKATDTLTKEEYNSDFKFRYIGAVVKFLKTKGDFDFSNQCKVIQFHPSYTYEDFVRGIVAKPNEEGNGIIYEAENKTLGDFARVAFDNFLASKGFLVDKSDFQIRFNMLIDQINSAIDSGVTFKFGEKSNAEIIFVGNNHLIYSFPERKEIRYKLLFSDIEKVYSIKEQLKIATDLRDKETELELIMKGKYPYYFMILKLLEKIKLPENFNKDSKVTKEKNYILIIDEINRANLSSVLGELIYALEYRGEEVESMYKIGDKNKLVLPPNLYIIGTMNTADRSVGHIDYAIRRRFAFVDVLPKDLSNEEEINFDSKLFQQVGLLFDTNLSPEFEKKDVQLGHSYFIDKSAEGGSMHIRLEYEIKPILLEYVKDGVLIGENIIEKIKGLETSI